MFLCLKCFFTSSAVGATVAGSAHTGAVLWGAGASVLTGAAVGAVGSPVSFLTHTVTMDTCTKHIHTHTQSGFHHFWGHHIHTYIHFLETYLNLTLDQVFILRMNDIHYGDFHLFVPIIFPRNLRPHNACKHIYVPATSAIHVHTFLFYVKARGFVLCYPTLESRQADFPNAAHKVSEVSLKVEKGEERMMQKQVGGEH